MVAVQAEESTGRRFVELPNGQQKSVRVENLCPQPDPDASGLLLKN